MSRTPSQARYHHAGMPIRPAALVCMAVAAAGCAAEGSDPRLPRPRLAEKGQYQALYAPDGRLERLLYDSNGDRRADVVSLYGADGKLQRSEIDTDFDGVVDRREWYDGDGRLTRVDPYVEPQAQPERPSRQ